MESRAAELLELRKAEQDTAARQAHCSAVAKKQEEQLQVCVFCLCVVACVCVCACVCAIVLLPLSAKNLKIGDFFV